MNDVESEPGTQVAELEPPAPKKAVNENVRVPSTVSPAVADALRAGKKIRGRAVRNTQKQGYQVGKVQGQLRAGKVYDFPPDVFLVLHEAGYVEEYGG